MGDNNHGASPILRLVAAALFAAAPRFREEDQRPFFRRRDARNRGRIWLENQETLLVEYEANHKTTNLKQTGGYSDNREMCHSRPLEDAPNASNLCSLGDYQLHFEREGFASIRQISSGEIMHLRSSPIEEARALYVQQSGLLPLLARSTKPIVVWDVGLGAAANAMAAIECYEEQSRRQVLGPLTIISFENDLDSLALGRSHLEKFPYLDHEASQALLEKGNWRSREHPNLSWILVPGDFAQTIGTGSPPPDIVFYDMFSSRNFPEHWRLEIFQQLFAICDQQAMRLVTYSRSTSARAAMLAAGFYVARGRASGAQEESTIALTPSAAGANHSYDLLDSRWLEKWERSRARYPAALAEDERAALGELIRNHPQFRASLRS